MLGYATSFLGVVPIRETISHRSGMVTQLLFGEQCVILEQFQNWYKIRVQFDNYEGWVEKKQLHEIDEKSYKKILEEPTKTYLNSPMAFVRSDRFQIPILIGSSLPFFENNSFSIGNEKFILENGETYTTKQPSLEKVSFFALKYYKSPYLWGGRSFFGLDCSGFVQNVFRVCGYPLPRNSVNQAEEGQVINFISEAKAGDLLFFDNDEDVINHVGIYIGNQQIIHASGEVRIDKIDHHGIFNESIKEYSHKLRLIKRLG